MISSKSLKNDLKNDDMENEKSIEMKVLNGNGSPLL